MADAVLETIIKATDQFSKTLNEYKNKLGEAGAGTEKLKNTTKSMFDTMMNIGKATAVFSGLKNVISGLVDASVKNSEALLGLKSVAAGLGLDYGKVEKAAKELSKDGLMPLSESVLALKNLLAHGMTIDQAVKAINTFKDSAAFGRQASLSFSEAVVSATEGLKNENSILVDNAGITKNVSKMWEEYAKSIGSTSDKLTKAQKVTAEIIGLEKEAILSKGNAAKLTDTYTGKMAMLNKTIGELKQKLGDELMPTLTSAIGFFQKIANILTNLPEPIKKTALELGLLTAGIYAASKAFSALGIQALATFGKLSAVIIPLMVVIDAIQSGSLVESQLKKVQPKVEGKGYWETITDIVKKTTPIKPEIISITPEKKDVFKEKLETFKDDIERINKLKEVGLITDKQSVNMMQEQLNKAGDFLSENKKLIKSNKEYLDLWLQIYELLTKTTEMIKVGAVKEYGLIGAEIKKEILKAPLKESKEEIIDIYEGLNKISPKLKELSDITKNNFLKNLAMTLQEVKGIRDEMEAIKTAQTAGGVGGALGMFGGILGLVGGVYNIFSAIFGGQEKTIKTQEKLIDVIGEQNKLLDKQKNIYNGLLDIQTEINIKQKNIQNILADLIPKIIPMPFEIIPIAQKKAAQFINAIKYQMEDLSRIKLTDLLQLFQSIPESAEYYEQIKDMFDTVKEVALLEARRKGTLFEAEIELGVHIKETEEMKYYASQIKLIEEMKLSLSPQYQRIAEKEIENYRAKYEWVKYTKKEEYGALYISEKRIKIAKEELDLMKSMGLSNDLMLDKQKEINNLISNRIDLMKDDIGFMKEMGDERYDTLLEEIDAYKEISKEIDKITNPEQREKERRALQRTLTGLSKQEIGIKATTDVTLQQKEVRIEIPKIQNFTMTYNIDQRGQIITTSDLENWFDMKLKPYIVTKINDIRQTTGGSI